MQHLEVSGAVRHIYVVRRLKVKGKKSILTVKFVWTVNFIQGTLPADCTSLCPIACPDIVKMV